MGVLLRVMEKSSWRGIFVEYKTLWATLGLTLLALLKPEPGGHYYKQVRLPLLTTLFGFLGLQLDVSELRRAVKTPRLHVGCQVYSLLVTPVAYYVFLYRWGLVRRILNRNLAVGIMATMCLPTTTNTNVMFTQQAHGDVSTSAINAALGNLLGAFVTPVTVSFFIGTDLRIDAERTLVKVAVEIIAPFLGGLILQQGLPHSDTLRPYFRQLSTVIILLVIYGIFADSFSSQEPPRKFLILCLVLLVIHVVIVLGAWLVSGKLTSSKEHRIAFLFTAPQKTESLGVALVSSIFNANASLTLPIVVYHTIQMIVAAFTVPSARRYLGCLNQSDDITTSDDDDRYYDDPLLSSSDDDDADLEASVIPTRLPPRQKLRILTSSSPVHDDSIDKCP